MQIVLACVATVALVLAVVALLLMVPIVGIAVAAVAVLTGVLLGWRRSRHEGGEDLRRAGDDEQRQFGSASGQI